MEGLVRDVSSALFCGALAYVAYRYVRKRKNPDKSVWTAWLQFVGILLLAVVGTLAVLVGAVEALGLADKANTVGRVFAPIIVIGVLAPAWRYANVVIKHS